MASRDETPEDWQAIVDHFRTLPLEQQEKALKACQEIIQEAANKEREELLARLKALDALTGREAAPLPRKQGAADRASKPTGGKLYRSKKDANLTTTGGGRPPSWLTEEMAEFGLTKDAFLVSE